MKPTILSAVLSVVLLADVAGASCPDRSGSVEPRLQLGTPPTLVLDLGTCGCTSASVSVSCTPTAYAGTAGVACTTNGAVVTFSGPLPNLSCCTLTFAGDIVDVRTLAILEGDVNRDCGVSSSDAGSVVCCMGTAGTCGNPTRDVNRDCFISSSDESSVEQRLGFVAPPCPCP